MPHDPGIAAIALGVGSALLSLFAMARVACMDARRMEIDPAWIAVAACAGLAAVLAVEGPGAWPGAVGAAAMAGGAGWLAVRLHPGWVGQSDIGLLAMLGLLSGPRLLLPVIGLSVAFFPVAFFAYGLARGKRRGRIFRHMIPLAPPYVAALAPAFAWRIASAVRPDLVPAGTRSALAVSLAGVLALAGMLLAGALPMAARRRAMAAGSRACPDRTRQPNHQEED